MPHVQMQDTLFSRLSGKIKSWPNRPGVYVMRGSEQKILYIGKAKSLRKRIRSYFQTGLGQAPKVRFLMRKVVDIEFIVTTTELEALLLECNLIKKHRPRYNVRLKDDKNYPYVALDFSHPFPQFRITRKLVPNSSLKYFGPFSSGVKEISRFLLKTFQIRDCSDSKFRNRTRPCLNYEIGTCMAPCVNRVSQEDYGKQVRQAILFLKGKRFDLLKDFRKSMVELSHAMKFEQASLAHDKIRAIEAMTEKQSSILTDKQLDIDVVGRFDAKSESQWVILFLRSGLLTGRRAERTALYGIDSPDELMRTFLEQFYSVSLIPDEIWVAHDFPDREILQKFLSQRAQKKVRIQVTRGEKPLRLLGMAYENAKLLYESPKKEESAASAMLQKALKLSILPEHIEGIDVSNIQGESPAVALVHFFQEKPQKNRYRIYYPKTVTGQNDFAMIYEVITRRLKASDNPLPELFVIDGGKGQLGATTKAMDEVDIHVAVLALAKSRTTRNFASSVIKKSVERIFVPNRKNPIMLREGSLALGLLQQVRDEAHRFSVRGHRIRRKKTAFEKTPLSEIRGIGEKAKKKLLEKFCTLAAIGNATDDELKSTGLSKAAIQNMREYFSSHGSLGPV